MKLLSLFTFILFLSPVLFAQDSSIPSEVNPWSLFLEPFQGDSQIFGYYRSGCLIGAQDLPPRGTGYETVNRHRVRHFGHPEMISLLTSWAQEVDQTFQAKLIIGDISQPAGGPANGGHASHQIGLDADIRFALINNTVNLPDNNENYETPSMVKYSSQVIKKKTVYSVEFLENLWDERMDHVLEMVAQNPQVQRMFINAPIKRHMCQVFKKSDGSYPSWLEKLRPETGHVYHFHVRLFCPQGSPNCTPQEAVSKDATDKTGVGCSGESYDYWFSQSALKGEFGNPETVPSAPASAPPPIPYWQQVMQNKKFPAACKDLLKVDKSN